MRHIAENLGLGVAQVLQAGGRGTVIAAFTRSVYLRFPAGLVCLGAPAIGRGPLNLTCREGVPRVWQNVTRPGMPTSVDGTFLTVGSLRINFEEATIWSPPSMPDWSDETARGGISRLRAALPPDIPQGGLGAWLALPEAGRCRVDPVLRRAMPAIDELSHWVAGDLEAGPPEAPICSLLGLGPGLTPSGDDFLGGLLVALRLAGHPGSAERLAHAIENLGANRTNDISLAHLRAARRFGLTEKLHQIADGIVRGWAAEAHGTRIARFMPAQHSPWDTLAGLIMTFEARLGQPFEAPRAASHAVKSVPPMTQIVTGPRNLR